MKHTLTFYKQENQTIWFSYKDWFVLGYPKYIPYDECIDIKTKITRCCKPETEWFDNFEDAIKYIDEFEV